MTFIPGRFLIVDARRESRATRPVRSLLGRYRDTDVSLPLDALEQLTTDSNVTGVVIGQQVGSADVLALLEVLSRRKHRTSAAVCTRTWNRFLLGSEVTVLESPLRLDSVKSFLQRALALEILADDFAVEALLAFAERHALAPRETEVLCAAVAGISGREYLDATGTAVNTRKRQIQSILRKSGFPGIDRTVIHVLRDALAILQERSAEIAVPRWQMSAATTRANTPES
jgi:hypothetical protein